MQSYMPFHPQETHGMVFRPSVELQETSAPFGWTTLFAAAQVELPYEGSFTGVQDQLLIWHRNGPATIEGEDGDKRFCETVPAGGFHLIPRQANLKINLRNQLSTMHVYIRRGLIEEVASELVLGDPARVEIPSRIIDGENMLSRLVAPLEHALSHCDSSSAFCGDYLSLTIAAHLIRHYSNATVRPNTQVKDPQSCILERSIEFMRANLHEPIRLSDIARAVNLSSSHLARIFKAKYGTPPHRYLINLRAQKAGKLLQATNMPIAEIALECGFAHQEHLTHQFRHIHGITPAAYRRAQRS